MTGAEFGALFDRFQHSAFRLETLPAYDVPEEAEDLASWRAGRSQPERSVRTSPWLARMAVTTAAGRSWQRVRLVSSPPTEYERYEFGGYVESQACGEEIRVALRAPALVAAGDFWLFDVGTPGACAAVMHYDPDGRYLDADLVTDPASIRSLADARGAAWRAGQPLNEYLAEAHPLRDTA